MVLLVSPSLLGIHGLVTRPQIVQQSSTLVTSTTRRPMVATTVILPKTAASSAAAASSFADVEQEDTADTAIVDRIASNAVVSQENKQNSILNNDELDTNNNDCNVEFPPPLSTLDRMKRAATFWSTTIPIVANYYGLIGNIKLQELLGNKMTEDDVEVSDCEQKNLTAMRVSIPCHTPTNYH
jgi:hypothetical protein